MVITVDFAPVPSLLQIPHPGLTYGFFRRIRLDEASERGLWYHQRQTDLEYSIERNVARLAPSQLCTMPNDQLTYRCRSRCGLSKTVVVFRIPEIMLIEETIGTVLLTICHIRS